MTTEQRIIVTETDLQRLQRMLEHHVVGRDSETADMLEAELARAEVVRPGMAPGNAVTMNSSVIFEDAQTGEQREVTLVYPAEASPSLGRVSILAPIGTALPGLAVGQSIDWPLPGGRTKQLRIVKAQPPGVLQHLDDVRVAQRLERVRLLLQAAQYVAGEVELAAATRRWHEGRRIGTSRG